MPAQHRPRSGSDLEVPAGIVLGLAVTVRAEKLKVLNSVVQPVAVDVMQRKRDGFAAPTGQTAALTYVELNSGVEQMTLEVTAVAPRAGSEDLSQR